MRASLLIKVRNVCIFGILMLLCACNKTEVGVSDVGDEETFDLYKFSNTYYLPLDTDIYSLRYEPENESIICVCGHEDEKVIRIHRDGTEENEIVYNASGYILSADCVDNEILVGELVDDDIVISEISASDIISSAVSLDKVGDYPYRILKYMDGRYILVSEDSIYITGTEACKEHRIVNEFGNITDCEALPDGRIAAICNDSNRKFAISIFDVENKKMSPCYETSEEIIHCVAIDGEVFVSDCRNLYRYEEENHIIKKVFCFESNGVYAERFNEMSCGEDEIDVISIDATGYDNCAKVYSFRDNSDKRYGKDEKEVVFIYATNDEVFEGLGVSSVIADFNDENNKYQISILRYEGGTVDSIVTKDVHPDIMFEINAPLVENYADSGYLDNLWPYIDKSELLTRDDLCMKFVEPFIIDGDLYALPQCVQLDGILIPKSQKETMNNEWTTEGFLDWIERNSDVTGDESLNQQEILRICFMGLYPDLVDEEACTADFDSQYFINILERVKGIKLNAESEIPLSIYEIMDLEQKPTFIKEYGISSAASLALYEKILNEKFVFAGYPGKSGEGYDYVTPIANVGIFSNSEHKEGAYEFIEYYVTYPRKRLENKEIPDSSGTLWSLNDLLEESLSQTKEVTYENIDFGSIEADDYDIEIVEEMINACRPLRYTQSQIWQIVKEEFDTVVSGMKTVAEACKVIQSRSSIVLEEKR